MPGDPLTGTYGTKACRLMERDRKDLPGVGRQHRLDPDLPGIPEGLVHDRTS